MYMPCITKHTHPAKAVHCTLFVYVAFKIQRDSMPTFRRTWSEVVIYIIIYTSCFISLCLSFLINPPCRGKVAPIAEAAPGDHGLLVGRAEAAPGDHGLLVGRAEAAPGDHELLVGRADSAHEWVWCISREGSTFFIHTTC
jgi:hypothetical protein